MEPQTRPDIDSYFMQIAEQVAQRANCGPSGKARRSVGAVLVLNERIIATGYNGTPSDMTNCDVGGCHRCAGNFDPGTLYDICLCVHAEENAIASAAKHGIAVNGAVIYTTLQPCFSCAKTLLQAGVREVIYGNPWSHPHADKDADLAADFERLMAHFPGGVHPLSSLKPAA
jgi:dCMP deaminase